MEPKNLAEQFRSNKIYISDLYTKHLLKTKDIFKIVNIKKEVLKEQIEILLKKDNNLD